METLHRDGSCLRRSILNPSLAQDTPCSKTIVYEWNPMTPQGREKSQTNITVRDRGIGTFLRIVETILHFQNGTFTKIRNRNTNYRQRQQSRKSSCVLSPTAKQVATATSRQLTSTAAAEVSAEAAGAFDNIPRSPKCKFGDIDFDMDRVAKEDNYWRAIKMNESKKQVDKFLWHVNLVFEVAILVSALSCKCCLSEPFVDFAESANRIIFPRTVPKYSTPL
ncbi:hypothetical protein BC936DRAFT_144947 [Jimgerdemannia flammicorona]|uniref:Uncharacterized protein n=1 Tax=Jimgerdemannia flammicorona TaxID=994334 RepID=A0A433DNF8_9FUNG|nr:hypothetical protein BC936DRAFT_144947 [Jimgerdemannia flammicorona]